MKVTIFTTPTCVYCRAVKQFFADHSISYEEKDVLGDIQARSEMVDKSGQLGVPVIEIDGKIVVGFNKRKLAEFLNVRT